MRISVWGVAVVLGLAACSEGADEASQQGRPDAGDEPAATTTSEAPAALPAADGPFDGTCPTDRVEASAALGVELVLGDPAPDGCDFALDDGSLDVRLVVTWGTRDDSGSQTDEVGSSTSQTNDSGDHRTSQRFETEHWEGSVVVTYDWDGRAAPDFERGKTFVGALAARIEEGA